MSKDILIFAKYTRKLRQHGNVLNLHSHNIRLVTQHAYTDLKEESERQQAIYERKRYMAPVYLLSGNGSI